MIAAILGYPGAGKRTLCARLSEEMPSVVVVTHDTIRAMLKTPASSAAKAACIAADSGARIPDETFGRLLAETARGLHHHVLLLGLPRNILQLEAMQGASGVDVHVIHLRATPELIDERRQSADQQRADEAHPGALTRITAELAPMLADAASAGRLLELDAGLAREDITRLALEFIGPAQQ